MAIPLSSYNWLQLGCPSIWLDETDRIQLRMGSSFMFTWCYMVICLFTTRAQQCTRTCLSNSVHIGCGWHGLLQALRVSTLWFSIGFLNSACCLLPSDTFSNLVPAGSYEPSSRSYWRRPCWKLKSFPCSPVNRLSIVSRYSMCCLHTQRPASLCFLVIAGLRSKMQ